MFRRSWLCFALPASLLQQWSAKNPSSSNDFDPTKLSPLSPRWAKWDCPSCQSTWSAPICQRANAQEDRGCPTCSSQYRLIEEHPRLALEWNVGRNAAANGVTSITLEEVPSYSQAKVWWKCTACQTDFKASPQQRTEASVGCPRCASTLSGTSISAVDPKQQFPSSRSSAQNSPGSAPRPQKNTVGGDPLLAAEVVGMSSVSSSVAALALDDDESARSGGSEQQIEAAKEVPLDSHQRLRWRCQQCDLAYTETVRRRHQGIGCPRCACDRRHTPPLSVSAPEIDRAIFGLRKWTRTELRPKDATPVMFQCPGCGEITKIPVRELCFTGWGCPKCRWYERNAGERNVSRSKDTAAARQERKRVQHEAILSGIER